MAKTRTEAAMLLPLFIAILPATFQPKVARADVPISTTTSDSEISVRIGKPDYSFTKAGEGAERIDAPGLDLEAIPGRPQLPRGGLYLALPPSVNPESVEVSVTGVEFDDIPGEHAILPAAPARLWNTPGTVDESARKDPAVYLNNSFYPAAPVRSYGVSMMRGWNVLKITYLPFQYNPVTGTLRVIRSLTARAIWRDGSGQPKHGTLAAARVASEDPVMEEMGPRLIANYRSVKNLYFSSAPARMSEPAGRGYAIITTEAIRSSSSELDSFIAHKQALGFTVEVVTERQYGSLQGQQPNGRAEKIRQWLKDNYLGKQIEYALLLGDPAPDGDVPMKRSWPITDGSGRMDSPTDYFYADLTGNWDLNADGTFGNFNHDGGESGVDFLPEVYVGRIPVYHRNTVKLDGILRKIRGYEHSADTSWRKSTLLPMSFADRDTDMAAVAEHAKNDYLTGLGFSTWTMYQRGSSACGMRSAYRPDEELVGGLRVVNRWAADTFGLVFWSGHGSSRGTYVGFEGCWDDGASRGNGEIIESDENVLLNDGHPSVIFAQSCLNGRPEDSSNLAYALLEHGAVATVAASRDSWYRVGAWTPSRNSADNAAIGYYFMKSAAEGLPFGAALYDEKAKMGFDWDGASWMNLMDFNLYGDPSVRLFSSNPPSTTSGPAPSASWIFDDSSARLRYSGRWARKGSSIAQNGSYHVSRRRGSKIATRFSGTRHQIDYFKGPSNGTMRVTIDGRTSGRIGQRGSAGRASWASKPLKAGRHSLALRAISAHVSVDAITVFK